MSMWNLGVLNIPRRDSFENLPVVWNMFSFSGYDTVDPYLGAKIPYLGMFAQDSGKSEHTTLVSLVWEKSYKYV